MTALVLVIGIAIVVVFVLLLKRSKPNTASGEQSPPDRESLIDRPAAEIAEAHLVSVAGEEMTAELLRKKIRCIWNDKAVRQRNLDYVRRGTANGNQLSEIEIMVIAYERHLIENRAYDAGPAARTPALPRPPRLAAEATARPPDQSENNRKR